VGTTHGPATERIEDALGRATPNSSASTIDQIDRLPRQPGHLPELPFREVERQAPLIHQPVRGPRKDVAIAALDAKQHLPQPCPLCVAEESNVPRERFEVLAAADRNLPIQIPAVGRPHCALLPSMKPRSDPEPQKRVCQLIRQPGALCRRAHSGTAELNPAIAFEVAGEKATQPPIVKVRPELREVFLGGTLSAQRPQELGNDARGNGQFAVGSIRGWDAD
jgi:hypothetical protein